MNADAVFQRESDAFWEALSSLQGSTFQTAKGLSFTFYMRGNELIVSRKYKPVTRASVDLALRRAKGMNRITGPKQLGTFGASYLYPLFLAAGVIRHPEQKTLLDFLD